jgi:hypothetical protein
MLRAAFASAPILQHFDPNLLLMLIIDASNFAYAGILLQLATDAEGMEYH